MGGCGRLTRWLVAVPTVFVGCSMGSSAGDPSVSPADDSGPTIAEAGAPDAALGADVAGDSGAKDSSTLDAAAGDASTADAGTSQPPPPGAVTGGYSINTFVSDFTELPSPTTTPPVTSQSILVDSNMIDANDSEVAGFKWYPNCWTCSGPAPASAFSVVDDQGVNALRIDGSGAAGGNSIYGALSGHHGVVGKTFSGGAYFEARIAMALPANGSGSWPAFWALPNLAGNALTWPGNTNTVQFNNTTENYYDSVELDILELMPLSETGQSTPAMGSTLHNWYGFQGYTCTANGQWGFCQVPSSAHDDDTATLKFDSTAAAPVFHTIGALWVPWSSATPSTPGYVQFFVDDQPFLVNGVPNKTTWIGTPPTSASASNDYVPTTSTPWTFGAMDLWSQGLILGTGGGAFMDVQWVKVWQKP